MSQLDVIDEAVIGADCAVVFDAIVALMAGEASWWVPHLYVRALGEKQPAVVGRLSEVRVPGRARFVARIEEALAPTRLRVTYVSGDFRGDGLWTFEVRCRAAHASASTGRWTQHAGGCAGSRRPWSATTHA
jgi:hypothetical protein